MSLSVSYNFLWVLFYPKNQRRVHSLHTCLRIASLEFDKLELRSGKKKSSYWFGNRGPLKALNDTKLILNIYLGSLMLIKEQFGIMQNL